MRARRAVAAAISGVAGAACSLVPLLVAAALFGAAEAVLAVGLTAGEEASVRGS